ncbi:protein DYAD-like [Prunus yedoensis var. nudiflora]|uniref:Protein DYAD-like n=1 Tax=Prunus yedoensis var. nudiflora TaxID=2094558 RepID=A0A314UKN8_PRUYE|nr:protein DYAD-like [Prunus yedoensis var. nudiflora]
MGKWGSSTDKEEVKVKAGEKGIEKRKLEDPFARARWLAERYKLENEKVEKLSIEVTKLKRDEAAALTTIFGNKDRNEAGIEDPCCTPPPPDDNPTHQDPAYARELKELKEELDKLRSSKEVEVSYLTSYGTKEGINEAETSYIAQYNSRHNSKEAEVSYITSYGTKEDTKEAETPYITQYNSGHNSKEAEVPYITSYGTKEGKKEDETPYITQYNSGHNSKEAKVSYITSYGTKKDKRS